MFIRRAKARAIGATLKVLTGVVRTCAVHMDSLVWRRHNLCYRGCSEDIFVVSYPKSGTTLVQALLYQMTTDGSFDLPHIASFSPALDAPEVLSRVRGGHTIDSLPPPHVFKSHFGYDRTPKGDGRYIYVVRNGLDVAVSYYYHCRNYRGYNAPFPDFFKQFMAGQVPYGSWFTHVTDWLRNEHALNILVITYEDLRANLLTTARELALFCDLRPAEGEWPRIVANCSFEAMRAHESKYESRTSWPADDPEDAHFIRRGRVGGWRSMIDPEMLAEFRTEFDKAMCHIAVPPGICHHSRPAEASISFP